MTRDVGPDQQVPGVRRVDGDRAYRAILRHGLTPLQQCPVPAAVGRLVQADAGLAVGGAVRLARADVDRPLARIGRVDEDRADRVRVDLSVRDVPPMRMPRDRVLRHPQAAAGGRDVEPAVALVTGPADRNSGHPARPLCGRRRRSEFRECQRRGCRGRSPPTHAKKRPPCLSNSRLASRQDRCSCENATAAAG